MLKRSRGNRRVAQGSSAPRWWRIDWRSFRWRRIGMIGGAFALAGLVLLGLATLGDRPVGKIVVEGPLQRVSGGDVEAAVRRELGKVGFVSVDLNAVQRAVQALPWVDHATIMKRWPNSLAVRITEQVAEARWGESDLVNARGERFISGARFIPPELPRLSGPEGSEALAVARYQALQGRVIGAGMHITSLSLDARGALSLTLDNGVSVRFGRSQVDQRIERFIATALPLIGQRASDIAYIDMRYGNGFAVGWRAAATRIAMLRAPRAASTDRETTQNG